MSVVEKFLMTNWRRSWLHWLHIWMKIIIILLLTVMKNDESSDNQNQIEKMMKGLIQSNIFRNDMPEELSWRMSIEKDHSARITKNTRIEQNTTTIKLHIYDQPSPSKSPHDFILTCLCRWDGIVESKQISQRRQINNGDSKVSQLIVANINIRKR